MHLQRSGIMKAVSHFNYERYHCDSIQYVLGTVGWVTQLVVSVRQRKRYIATSLLQSLKDSPIFKGITAIGLVSSHPAACGALGKYSGMWPFAPQM